MAIYLSNQKWFSNLRLQITHIYFQGNFPAYEDQDMKIIYQN